LSMAPKAAAKGEAAPKASASPKAPAAAKAAAATDAATSSLGVAPTFRHIFTQEHKGNIDEYFEIERKDLGEGSYGVVNKARDKATDALRAVKTIDLKKVTNAARFEKEVAIQQNLDHPHIVKLYDVFKDAKKMYLVMELCTGGELFDRIVAEAEKHADDGKEGQAFDERGAANYMQQILGAMFYLHSKDFVHRDIKPENFLLQSKADNAAIKVIDFGLAKEFKPGSKELMKTKAGTPYYVAPQVLQGAYDEKCDIWSCGVICYILLCGYPPFYGDRDEDILRRVKKGDFDFPSPDWDEITSEGKNIIQSMLTLDPAKRPSAENLLDHAWLKHQADKPTGTIGSCITKQLKSFTGYKKLKKIALTMIAQQMKEQDIEELQKTFAVLDKNRDGTLTIQEITDGLINAKMDIPSDFHETLQNLDTDGSGQIDYTEFIAASLTQKQYMKQEMIWAAFRVFDKDGDGKITKEELKAVLQDGRAQEALGKEVDRLMAEADTDGDGTISFDEFKELIDEGTAKNINKNVAL